MPTIAEILERGKEQQAPQGPPTNTARDVLFSLSPKLTRMRDTFDRFKRQKEEREALQRLTAQQTASIEGGGLVGQDVPIPERVVGDTGTLDESVNLLRSEQVPVGRARETQKALLDVFKARGTLPEAVTTRQPAGVGVQRNLLGQEFEVPTAKGAPQLRSIPFEGKDGRIYQQNFLGDQPVGAPVPNDKVTIVEKNIGGGQVQKVAIDLRTNKEVGTIGEPSRAGGAGGGAGRNLAPQFEKAQKQFTRSFLKIIQEEGELGKIVFSDLLTDELKINTDVILQLLSQSNPVLAAIYTEALEGLAGRINKEPNKVGHGLKEFRKVEELIKKGREEKAETDKVQRRQDLIKTLRARGGAKPRRGAGANVSPAARKVISEF
jgi:hypothetical protein